MEHLLHTTANDTESHLRTTRTTQTFHNLFLRHLYTSDTRIIDRHDAVTGYYTHFLGRTVSRRLYDKQRIFDHIELHTDTVEVALQGFVHGFDLFGIGISGMRIKFLQHAADGILHQFLFIDSVHVEVVDGHLGNLQFAKWRTAA